ncbi:MAG: hypothetical protein GY898_20440 [Proteobacteria bacterium]|nr:hypothetical protein [Pseudomonadota bacterium]
MLPDGFVDLPALVFADDPGWIPEEPASVQKAFSAHNAWFQQGEAAAFCSPGSARVAAFFQPELRVEDRRVAFFGYWCSAGDGGDAELFAQAEAWARDRGAQDVYGPINFTTYGHYRIRLSVESDEATTFPDEPHNPTTWPGILEEAGYSLDQQYLTQTGLGAMGLVVAQMKRPVVDQLLSEGYRVESFTHADWMDRLRELHGIIDAVFGANFAYSPLSWPTFEAKCGEGFIRRADPEVSTACYGPDGSLAGFFLVYPHYGALVCQGAGADRAPTGDLDFATHWPQLKDRPWRAAIAKTVGVNPAHRGKGVMAALTGGIFERGAERYPHWYGAMIRQGNLSSNYARGNTTGERWYGLYRKRLD